MSLREAASLEYHVGGFGEVWKLVVDTACDVAPATLGSGGSSACSGNAPSSPNSPARQAAVSISPWLQVMYRCVQEVQLSLS